MFISHPHTTSLIAAHLLSNQRRHTTRTNWDLASSRTFYGYKFPWTSLTSPVMSSECELTQPNQMYESFVSFLSLLLRRQHLPAMWRQHGSSQVKLWTCASALTQRVSNLKFLCVPGGVIALLSSLHSSHLITSFILPTGTACSSSHSNQGIRPVLLPSSFKH